MVDSYVVTGVTIGTFAAVGSAGLLLRRLLQVRGGDRLSRIQRCAVYLGAITLLSPAFTVGFTLSKGLVLQHPPLSGGASDLAMALVVACTMACVGTIASVAAGSAVLEFLLRRNKLA